MDQFNKFRAFVLVAEKQSFSKAAQALGVTTGAVSRIILRLEKDVHLRLFHRTTRSVMLTDEARPYYETCCRMLEEMDEANRRITNARETESGKLNLAVHPVLASSTLSRLVTRYRDMSPNVNLNVIVQNCIVNLASGRIDIAIFPSHLIEQPTVIRRTLSISPGMLVASPGYLDRYGAPVRASGLDKRFLLLNDASSRVGGHALKLLEDGKRIKVPATSSMTGDEQYLRAAALAGAGIAVLPEMMVQDDLRSGCLVPVLPHCSVLDGEVDICLFYAHRDMLSARLRAFVNFCIEFFREESAASGEGLAATHAEPRSGEQPVLAAA
ncbi:LysR family regulatory protein [Burkholderia lata]|uniref:LysR family transcriptional regulator n=1 Tax=Burkholderia lata (strain ATCC 17760 / DSM 23089 / LMG 22485 / NCIMB 9086 / R18194 / 383) TaxID=482957 RepID=UPI00145488AD|nr:LysR family transcriptional regulator [Burkholderia lata]VWB37662.1 LysR family regulatory protein [Burkholderia lata]